MKKLIVTLICIAIGIFLIPSLFAMAVGIFGTVVAFISNPKVMMVAFGILAVLSLPGIIIGLLAKR